MGKGKKPSGKHYVSKGERRSSMKTGTKDPAQKMLNKIKALNKGKDVIWSLPNVDKDGKVHPNTKIRVSGKDWIKRQQNMKPASGGND